MEIPYQRGSYLAWIFIENLIEVVFPHAKKRKSCSDVVWSVLSMTSYQDIEQNPISHKLVEYKLLPIIKLSKTLTGDAVW